MSLLATTLSTSFPTLRSTTGHHPLSLLTSEPIKRELESKLELEVGAEAQVAAGEGRKTLTAFGRGDDRKPEGTQGMEAEAGDLWREGQEGRREAEARR